MIRQRPIALRRRTTPSFSSSEPYSMNSQIHKLPLLLCLSVTAVLALLATLSKRKMRHNKRLRNGRRFRVRSRYALWKRLISTHHGCTEDQELSKHKQDTPTPSNAEHIEEQSNIGNTIMENKMASVDTAHGPENATLNSDSDDLPTGNILERVRLPEPSSPAPTLAPQTPQPEHGEHESIDSMADTTRQAVTPAGITESAPVTTIAGCLDVDAGARGNAVKSVCSEPVEDTVIVLETHEAQQEQDTIGLDEQAPFNADLEAPISLHVFADSSALPLIPSTPPGLPPPVQLRTPLRASAAPFVPKFACLIPTAPTPVSTSPDPSPSSDGVLDSSPYNEKHWNWTWYDKDEELKAMIERALQEIGANEEGSLRAVIEEEFSAEIEVGWKVALEKYEKKRRERRRWEADGEQGSGNGFMWTLKESSKNGGRKKTKKPFQQSIDYLDAQGNSPPHKPMHSAFASLYTKRPNQTAAPAPISPPPTPLESAGTFTPTCEGFWPADAIRDRAYTFLNKRTETQTAAEEAYAAGDIKKATELVVAEHRAYEIGVLFHDAAAALLFFVKNEGYFETVQEAMGSWRSGFTKKVKEMRRREKEMKRRESGGFDSEGSSSGHGSSDGFGDDEFFSSNDIIDADTSFDISQPDISPLEPITLSLPPVNPSKLRKCDLHGLLIREARHYVLQHLELCRAHRIESTDIVTGWGKSSKDNDAKLKPRVKEILEKYEEENEGKVKIDRKKRNDGMFTLRMSEW